MTKSVIHRFIRGFASSFVSTMLVTLGSGVVTPVSNWNDLSTYLVPIFFSALIGGFAGLALAADKWLRMDKPRKPTLGSPLPV
jgi:hypothetical protein